MSRFYCIIIFFLLSTTSVVYAQDSTGKENNRLRPYIGASVNISGVVPEVGIGLEVGIVYRMFYLAGEFGIYGYGDSPGSAGSAIPPKQGVQYPDKIVNQEQYFGFHAGIIVKNTFWIGAVFLWSSATMYHPFVYDTANRGYLGFDYILHVFEGGPDIRFTCWDHATLDFAYTNRRGLKIGMAYLF